MNAHLEIFRNQLLTYYPHYLLMADFTSNGKLLLLTKPFLDLEQVMSDLCDDFMNMVDFRQHVDIHLCQFGHNELIEISIN